MPTDGDNPFVRFAVGELSLADGEALFRQGAPARHLYLVREGRVRLLRHSQAGHAVCLHVAQAGGMCAEGALFAQAYHCDAVADGPARLAALDKAAMLAQMRDDPALAMLLLEMVTHQLHRARTLCELRNIRSARERLLQYLRLQAGQGGALTLAQPLARIADELGLTHEACYRALATLAREGAIAREGRRITLQG